MGAKKSSKASSTTTNSLADNRIVAGEGALVVGPDGSYYSDDDLAVTDSRTWLTDQSIRYADSSTRYTDNSFRDNSDRSTNILDASDRSTRLSYTDGRIDASDRSTNFLDFSDNSDRSSTAYLLDGSNRSVTNITGVDPGALKVAEFGADLVRDLNWRQTDGIKTIAGFAADLFREAGSSATDLFALAGSNQARGWADTISASERTYQAAVDRATQLQTETLGAATGLIGDILDRAGRTVDASGRLAEAALVNAQPTQGKVADGLKWALIAAAVMGGVIVVPKLLKAS